MRSFVLIACLLIAGSAYSSDLSSITRTDATSALRTALTQGASKAVAQLGQADGFLLNPEVKIPLPPQLQQGERLLRRFGFGAMADQLETTMNRAAEAAVSEAKPLLINTVKAMSVADAKAILIGGDDSATQYFRNKTQTALAEKFKPIVMQATGKVGVKQHYNSLAGKAAQFGLLDPATADIDDYVTARALDGLFKMIAKEEFAIRQDPIGQSSKLLKKVFGALEVN